MGWVLFIIGIALAVWHMRIDSGIVFKWLNVIGTVAWQALIGLFGLVTAGLGNAKEQADIAPALTMASIVGLVVSAGVALLRQRNYRKQVEREAAHINRVYDRADQMYNDGH